jgi:hypothetical protein
MREGSQRAVQMAMDRSRQDYQAYGGQRIADLSQNEQMGIGMARENVGAWQGDFESAREAIRQSGRSITEEGALEGYMNPYMEEVLAPQRRRQNEAFEAERAQRAATRGASNAFGGRGQMWENQFESEFQTRQDELTGSAYGAAFDRATQMFGEERDRDLRRAGAFQDVGEGAQSMRQRDLRDLMESGFIQRTQEQAGLDFQYLEYLEERDWDVNNMMTLVDVLSSVPHEESEEGSSRQEVKESDPLGTVIGVAAIAASAIMTGGSSLAVMGAAGGLGG